MGKKAFNFKQMKAVVLKTLGIDDFEEKEGKSILTAEQETSLGNIFGDVFVAKFKSALTEAETEEEETEAVAGVIEAIAQHNTTAIEQMASKFNAAEQARIAAEKEAATLKATNKTLQESIAMMADEADDTPDEIIAGGSGKGGAVMPWMGIKPNPKHFHTQMAKEYLNGETAKSMTSGSFANGNISANGETIDVSQLESEFGTYLSQKAVKLDIYKLLLAKTESQNYMTTKRAITEWRASTASITSVVQQFVAKWTPSGGAKFTPITIKNRRHKINLPITPDDINDSWLSYLYDEGMTVDQMPVTRYIIEVLLRPRIDSDIEMEMIATGVFDELVDVDENDAGQEPSKAMDGFLTLIKNFLTNHAGNNVEFFRPSEEITDENIVDIIEEYADFVANKKPLYAKKGMNIFIDPVMYTKYKRRYRAQYPTTKNEDKKDDRPDFSNLTFVTLENMRGSGIFFSTPKDNFIRLVHKNAAGSDTRLFLEVTGYTVKVYAEFWLGVGFALEELLFAYTPEVVSTLGLAEESGSGSGSASGSAA